MTSVPWESKKLLSKKLDVITKRPWGQDRNSCEIVLFSLILSASIPLTSTRKNRTITKFDFFKTLLSYVYCCLTIQIALWSKHWTGLAIQAMHRSGFKVLDKRAADKRVRMWVYQSIMFKHLDRIFIFSIVSFSIHASWISSRPRALQSSLTGQILLT